MALVHVFGANPLDGGTVRDRFEGEFSPSRTQDVIVTNVICRSSSSVDIVLLSGTLCVLVVVKQRFDIELVALQSSTVTDEGKSERSALELVLVIVAVFTSVAVVVVG